MTAKKTASKKITAKKATAIAPAIDMSADVGMGMEGADQSSFAIPFISILQGLSPQMETLEGARLGLIVNTITEELSTAVRIIPCAFQRRYLRWAPRREGGGYKGEYTPVEVETGSIEGQRRHPETDRWMVGEDDLVDTRNHFVLVESKSGAWTPAMLSLSSTGVKKSKRWMALINGIELETSAGKKFNPPSFSHIYKLTSIKEENNQGSWYSPVISIDSMIRDGDLYAKARAFNLSVQAGEVKVQEPGADTPTDNDTF